MYVYILYSFLRVILLRSYRQYSLMKRIGNHSVHPDAMQTTHYLLGYAMHETSIISCMPPIQAWWLVCVQCVLTCSACDLGACKRAVRVSEVCDVTHLYVQCVRLCVVRVLTCSACVCVCVCVCVW